MTDRKTVVIYHAACTDGFGAAWAAWKRFGDEATYIPAYHGAPPPHGLDGKDVIIADFCYERDELLTIEKKANSIRILDHHISAFRNVGDLPFATFDMNRSGAGIAWDELMGGKRPPLIDYIENGDLWFVKNLPFGKEVATYIEGESFTIERFNQLDKDLTTNFDKVVETGRIQLEFKLKRVAEAIRKSYYVDLSALLNLPDITMQVPCTNSSLFQNEIGNELAKHAPLGIVWYMAEDGKCRHSLRSASKYDCSQVAEHFGGGGHKNSAGFTTDCPLPRAVMSKG